MRRSGLPERRAADSVPTLCSTLFDIFFHWLGQVIDCRNELVHRHGFHRMYIFDDFRHFLRLLEHWSSWSSGPNHSHGQTQTLNLARSDMGTGRAWGGWNWAEACCQNNILKTFCGSVAIMVLGRYWWWWMRPLISVIVHILNFWPMESRWMLLLDAKLAGKAWTSCSCLRSDTGTRMGSPDIARLQYEDFSHTKVKGPVDNTCHVPFYKDYVTMSMDMGFGWWLRPQLSLMLQYSSVDGDKHCHLLFVYSL